MIRPAGNNNKKNKYLSITAAHEKITEKIYIIGKEGSLQRNDNDRKDVSKILHSDVSKILNSNL